MEAEMTTEIPKKEERAHGEIPFSVALVAGGAAGTSVDVVLFPIDTLKTRLQAPQGFWKAGGFRGIYNGLSAAAAGSAPGAATFFVSYETMKPIIHYKVLGRTDDMDQNPLSHMLAAGCGETTACLIRVPTEIVKQRMQTGKYPTLGYAFKDITKRYGLRGFYTGYLTTVMREIPFSFIQFPLYERFKLIGKKFKGSDLAPYQGAICGSFAGSISAALTCPLDVIKTRQMLGTDPDGVPYKGFIDTFTKISKREGFQQFFCGVGPRVSWIFLGGFFFFGAYEKTKSILLPVYGKNNP